MDDPRPIDDPKLRAAAEAGDAPSQFELGLAYANTSDPRHDPAKAAHWFGRAAEAGLGVAQIKYGVRLYYGDGVRKDHREAMRWYHAGFLNGLSIGAYNIGDLYDDSDEFAKNPIEAAAWFLISLQASDDCRERLAGLLPQFGHDDAAKVVARATMILELWNKKSDVESMAPPPGLSLEPPDGMNEEDTPVTLLSLLIGLWTATGNAYSRNQLIEELKGGESTLYGACRVLNPEEHANGQIPAIEPAFLVEDKGRRSMVLFSSRRNFEAGNPVPDTGPMATPCSKYIEIFSELGADTLRLDPGCFGDVMLTADALSGNKPGSAPTQPPSDVNPRSKLPLPPPFRVTFVHDGVAHLAEVFPRAKAKEEPDPSGRRIMVFGPGGTVIRVTRNGVEQGHPAGFEDTIVAHLNSVAGLRDGDFSDIVQLDESDFMGEVLRQFHSLMHASGTGPWEVTPHVTPFSFSASRDGGPGPAIHLNLRPRDERHLGLVSARMNLNEDQLRRLSALLRSDETYVSKLFDKYQVNPSIQTSASRGSGEFDVSKNKWVPTGDGDKPQQPFVVLQMDSGLSPMDADGAARYAGSLARLHLALFELSQRARRASRSEN